MKKFVTLLLIASSVLSCSSKDEVLIPTSKTYQGVELYKGATEFQYERNNVTYVDDFNKEYDAYGHVAIVDFGYSAYAIDVIKTVVYLNYNGSNYDYTAYYVTALPGDNGGSKSPAIVIAHSTKTDEYFIGTFPFSGESFLYTPGLEGDDRYILTTRTK